MRLSAHLLLAIVALATAVQAQRMTMQRFLSGDPLPVPFTSEKVAWLKMRHPVIRRDIRIISALTKEDGSDLRNLVACPLCSRCMHSSTLVTTKCGHGFHAECFSQHVEWNGEFCPTCGDKGPHNNLWKRTVLREALGIFDDGGWIPANPGRNESAGRITAGQYSELDSLQVDFASNEIRWLGVQATVVDTDKEIISAVEKSDSALLRGVTLCPICYECMHSTTIMTTKCGHTFHAQCFERYSKGNKKIPCPYCRNSGPHNNYWRGTLLKDALRLFENEGWIPEIPGGRMTIGEFRKGKPLPIDFSSAELQLLVNKRTVIDADKNVIEAIKHKNPDRLRDLIACPVCSQPMHSDTLGVTTCGHWVHQDCFLAYFDNIGDMCPVCNKGGPHQPLQRKSLLSLALKLFEREDWMPPNPERMTMEQFMITKSLPVDFESPEIQWLVRQEVQFGSEEKLLDAIKTRNREGIRDAVACPICKKCIHSASLKMAACGHAFHEDCVGDLLKCLSRDGRVQCACPVCSKSLTRESDVIAGNLSRKTMFIRALYLFEVEGWIPARGNIGISAGELGRLSPFDQRHAGFVPPENWLRHLLPARQRLPVESDTLQEYRYFVRDRFLAHIAMFIQVINEVANALDVCKHSSIVERIVKDYYEGRAVSHGMCHLPHRQLKRLDVAFFNKIQTIDGLDRVFASYGCPITEITRDGGKTLIYSANIRQRVMTTKLLSSKNRRRLFKKMEKVYQLFEYVQPVGGAFIPQVPNSTASDRNLGDNIIQSHFWPADPDAKDKDVPKTIANWLRTIAKKDGPIKSALEMGVRLIFDDARLDWMRKAAEWLLNLNTIASMLLATTIEVHSENMLNFKEHYTVLLGFIWNPVLLSSDLKSWKAKGWLKEMESAINS